MVQRLALLACILRQAIRLGSSRTEKPADPAKADCAVTSIGRNSTKTLKGSGPENLSERTTLLHSLQAHCSHVVTAKAIRQFQVRRQAAVQPESENCATSACRHDLLQIFQAGAGGTGAPTTEVAPMPVVVPSLMCRRG